MTTRIYVVAERYALVDDFIRAQNEASGRHKVDYVPCTEPHRMLSTHGIRVYFIGPMYDKSKEYEFERLFKERSCNVRLVGSDEVVNY